MGLTSDRHVLKISLKGQASTHGRIRVLVFNSCFILCLCKNEPLDAGVCFAFSEMNDSVLITITEPHVPSEGLTIILYMCPTKTEANFTLSNLNINQHTGVLLFPVWERGTGTES